MMHIMALSKYIPEDLAEYIKSWFSVPDNGQILELPELRRNHYVASADGTKTYIVEIQHFRKVLLNGIVLNYYAGYCEELNILYFWWRGEND